MFVIYFHNKFHTLSYNITLVIVTKPISRCHNVAQNPTKGVALATVPKYSKICYHIPIQDSIISLLLMALVSLLSPNFPWPPSWYY